MGTPHFAVPTFRALIEVAHVAAAVTNPDRRSGRGRKIMPPPVKVEAENAGITVFQPERIRNRSAVEVLGSFDAELFIVVAYGSILPRRVLEIPRAGCINVHASLLPKYRGAAPINWALINGEKETGVSIMKMDEGMDTGPVLAVEKTTVYEEDNVTGLSERLSRLGAELLVKTMEKAASNGVQAVEQKDEDATRAPMLKKEDGRLHWNRSAEEIAGRIRGTDPWPGGHTFFRGEKLKLFRPRVVAGSGRPGEVLGVDAGALVVACADGAVALKELQFPGKRRMEACCLLCGCPIRAGDILGNSGEAGI